MRRLKRPGSKGRERDELWVELIEGELDSSFVDDLSLLLLNSPADQLRLREFENLRELIKASDDVLLPEDGHAYDDLHGRIMAAVDGRKPKRPTRGLVRVSPRQLGFPALVGTSALTMMMAGVTMVSTAKPEAAMVRKASAQAPNQVSESGPHETVAREESSSMPNVENQTALQAGPIDDASSILVLDRDGFDGL